VEFVRENIDPMVHDGLEKNGLIALGIVGGGFAYLMCNAPIDSVEELKGQKIWIPEGDRISESILEAAEVTAVPLPLADVYTGLQTGLIDTIASSSMAAIAFQWHTRITNLIDVPLIYLIGIIVVDKRAFDGLSTTDQAVVRDVIARYSKHLDDLDRIDNEQAREALKQQGVSFHRPPPAELARWRKIAADATAILGDLGVYTPGMFLAVQQRLDEYRKQSRTINGD
jgi:TRAP-type C4-dicarboxylate transport system substrate-binding protein